MNELRQFMSWLDSRYEGLWQSLQRVRAETTPQSDKREKHEEQLAQLQRCSKMVSALIAYAVHGEHPHTTPEPWRATVERVTTLSPYAALLEMELELGL
jgi:hypothetical protein